MPFFITELEAIRTDIVRMGTIALKMAQLAIQSAEDSDISICERVIGMDDEIDDLEKKIHQECLRYLSLRAPVAADVRRVTTAMRACQDFERMGDEASSISKRVRKICRRQGKINNLGNIPEMKAIVLRQLNNVVEAFAKGDASILETVIADDKALDKLHRRNLKDVPMQDASDANAVSFIVDYSFISKSLERIGDHAVNIAEEIVFLVDAKDVRHSHLEDESEA